MMEEYRYIRKLKYHNKTCLGLYHIYRIKQIGKYEYEVWTREYDIKVCNITSKGLNYCFEKVS